MTLEEELEQQFASANQQSNGSENTEIVEQPEETTAEVDEWLDAPKSYKKEYQETFKELPQDWRKYLIDREKQAEKGFSDFGNKLNAYKYIDDAYNSRQQRLREMGINSAKEYNDYLYQIDDALTNDKEATIRLLANAYGVDLGAEDKTSADSRIEQQLFQLQQAFNLQQQYINEQKDHAAQTAVRDFMSAKAEDGSLKHPYFEDVKAEMKALLMNGLSTDLSDAYNKAIYMNEGVREKIIADKARARLQAKANEAEKAKLAGFQPKSKATPPEREMSLEEELGYNFDKFNL